MTEETVREPEMGLTLEKVWAMFQETDRKMQEIMQETDRKISRLGSRIGDLVEELIVPNILEKFNKLGYVFGKAAPNVRYRDSRGVYITEADILLENGDTALAVEVKTNLTDNDCGITCSGWKNCGVMPMSIRISGNCWERRRGQ
ncbi:MAG: hypothetical protein LBO80_04970 [Treponema sp.]|jgi:hypothetical protein|nr:hypothetical protein [Treponema sp.]